MKTNLVGVWSADALFAPGAQEDEIVVFRSDGTGWIEWMNYGAHTIEFFEWDPTSMGWMGIASRERFELDPHNRKQYIKVQPLCEVEHLPFTIDEVETPLLGVIPRLELQSSGWNAGLYGLMAEDADAYSKPQTPT